MSFSKCAFALMPALASAYQVQEQMFVGTTADGDIGELCKTSEVCTDPTNVKCVMDDLTDTASTSAATNHCRKTCLKATDLTKKKECTTASYKCVKLGAAPEILDTSTAATGGADEQGYCFPPTAADDGACIKGEIDCGTDSVCVDKSDAVVKTNTKGTCKAKAKCSDHYVTKGDTKDTKNECTDTLPTLKDTLCTGVAKASCTTAICCGEAAAAKTSVAVSTWASCAIAGAAFIQM